MPQRPSSTTLLSSRESESTGLTGWENAQHLQRRENASGGLKECEILTYLHRRESDDPDLLDLGECSPPTSLPQATMLVGSEWRSAFHLKRCESVGSGLESDMPYGSISPPPPRSCRVRESESAGLISLGRGRHANLGWRHSGGGGLHDPSSTTLLSSRESGSTGFFIEGTDGFMDESVEKRCRGLLNSSAPPDVVDSALPIRQEDSGQCSTRACGKDGGDDVRRRGRLSAFALPLIGG